VDLSRQIAALRQSLRDLGYEEGKNLMIEYRWAERKLDRLPSESYSGERTSNRTNPGRNPFLPKVRSRNYFC
jgi:hypothetical protein